MYSTRQKSEAKTAQHHGSERMRSCQEAVTDKKEEKLQIKEAAVVLRAMDWLKERKRESARKKGKEAARH